MMILPCLSGSADLFFKCAVFIKDFDSLMPPHPSVDPSADGDTLSLRERAEDPKTATLSLRERGGGEG